MSSFTISVLQRMRPGECIPTPRKYLRILRVNKWYVIQNDLLRTRKFYHNSEDVYRVIERDGIMEEAS